MLDTIPSPLSKYGKIPIAKTDDIIPESEAINNCVPISRGENSHYVIIRAPPIRLHLIQKRVYQLVKSLYDDFFSQENTNR